MAKNLDIDLPKMFARYAETNNQSLVEREFGVSRYRVVQLWKSLPESEQKEYESEIVNARKRALQEHSISVEQSTKNYLQRVDDVRDSLLESLETCVKNLNTTHMSSIARIKDASVALKNLTTLNDDNNKEPEDIMQKFKHLGITTDERKDQK